MAKTIAESLIEEGMERGLEKGREEGLEQGLEQGLERGRHEMELVASRAILKDLLEARFGALPAQLQLRIEQTEDAASLRSAARQILTISDPAELVL